jgi:hypothetical protein
VKRDAITVRDLLEDDEKVFHVWGICPDRIDNDGPARVRSVVVRIADHWFEVRPVDDAHGVVMVGGPAVSARLAQ